METFLALKFVHVMAAIAWVGGGLCFSIFGTIFECRGDTRSLLLLTRLFGIHGPAFLMPAALITLLSGVALFTIGAMPWAAWSLLALALVSLAFGICTNIMKTAGERVAYLMDVGRDLHAAAAARRLLRLARFECATMMAIIALMVMKPDWGDLAVLATIGAAMTIATIAYLVRFRPASA